MVATVLWPIASGLLAVYVPNFSSYNKTYGPLAGIVIILIWLWLSYIAILFGAEINAQHDHAKVVADGLSPEVRPFAQPRDTKELDESDKEAVREAQALRR